ALVDVAEDAKAELGVLVEHLALGDVVAEMCLDEIVVFQHPLNQRAHLIASFDTRILLEDPVAFRGKLLEVVPHPTTPLRLPQAANSRPQPTRDVTQSASAPQSASRAA